MRLPEFLLRAAAALCFSALIAAPGSETNKASGPFLFENTAGQASLSFRQVNFATDYKYPFETLGGAVAALDYNNDGSVDLFFLNGAPSPGHVRTDPASFNRLYKNNGDRTFSDVTDASGLSGKGIKGYPQGVAVGDYDNDGSLEAAVCRLNDSALLLKRKGGAAAHWLLLQLRGTRSNRDAIGARIQITTPSGLKQYQHLTTANGIYSASEKRVHFGLGNEDLIRSLEILWPSGIRQTLQDIKADRILKITEPEK